MEITIRGIAEKIAKEVGQKSLSELQELIVKKLIVFRKEYAGKSYDIEVELISRHKNNAEIVVSVWPISEEKRITQSTNGYYYKFKIETK